MRKFIYGLVAVVAVATASIVYASKVATFATRQVTTCQWPNICRAPESSIVQFQPCVWPNRCGVSVTPITTCQWPNTCKTL